MSCRSDLLSLPQPARCLGTSHWHQPQTVSAMWFPLFQLVSVGVLDITLEQQSIGVSTTWFLS